MARMVISVFSMHCKLNCKVPMLCVKLNARKFSTSLVKSSSVSTGTDSGNVNPRVPPFPVLADPIDPDSPHLAAATEVAHRQLEQLQQLTKLCMLGGGTKSIQQYPKSKLLPRDRVSRVWDDANPDSILEIGTLAGLSMSYGDIPGAGLVAAIGKVHGRYCLVCANDSTLKGGTYFPITTRKHHRAHSIAGACSLPTVLMVDSGGAFLPLQSEIFPDKLDGGRMFYEQAIHSSRGLPSVAVICGSCTAGGAYGPSMCDEAGIVSGQGTMFLGGPPLVKAALGETVGPEELGGATLHCSVSGGTDHFLNSEEEAAALVRDALATSPAPCPAPTTAREEPLYPSNTLDALSGLPSLDRPAMLAIISRLVDGSRFREFKGMYGSHLITGYGAIGGQVVGVAGNCGPLTYQDGLKGSHFVQLCRQRRLPLVFLQNSGVPVDGDDTLDAIRGRAAMAASVACLDTPKLTVNVAGCRHDDNYVMCGPGFSPTIALSWPSGHFRHSHSSFLDAKEDASTAKPVGKSKLQLPAGSSWHSAAHLLVDAVIAPRDTRRVLMLCLDICTQQRQYCQPAPQPVYRL